ncbi:DUF4405 domain-containing protein [Treponema zioleckii]|uniref:DUF4405 domain-containing protein n=1 Tax=Treponema zioleckii TaxID=331680 RepID=UPI00168A8681|nr:DUF4405 domain-containing protein [Treponema zioleckii]
MTVQQKFRMILDLSMTVLTLILMGGLYFFPWEGVHEILGVVLFVLWTVHVILNRYWYKSLFVGKYNAFRVMQVFVNCMILLCAILLMISGIILSNHVFKFLNLETGFSFARVTHLLASHWYFLFMSLHIGFHVRMIASRIWAKRQGSESESKKPKIISKIILLACCLYGLYAFISRGVWRYLILQQQFFFFDMEKGYLLFFVDYISIIILFATIMHYILSASRVKN